MHRIAAAVWMDLVPCLCTALGAGTVFLTGRRTAGPGRGAMGLSAGIMLGAGLFGLLLRAEGEVLAFTIGSLINPETVDVHF